MSIFRLFKGRPVETGVLSSGAAGGGRNTGRNVTGSVLESSGSGIVRVTGVGKGKFILPGEEEAGGYGKLFHIVGLGLLPMILGFGLSRWLPRIAVEESKPEPAIAAKPFPVVVEATAVAPQAPEVVQALKQIEPQLTTEQTVRDIFNQLKFKELSNTKVNELFNNLNKIFNDPETDAKVKAIIQSGIMEFLNPEKQVGVKR